MLANDLTGQLGGVVTIPSATLLAGLLGLLLRSVGNTASARGTNRS